MLHISEISKFVDKQEEKEFESAFRKHRKLRDFYNKELSRGWDEESATLNTYDEWFFNREIYK
jgi:hypothetical protein